MTNFGPWTPDIDPAERLARTRTLRALVRVYTGPKHPTLLESLRRAEADPAALAEAASLFDALPAIPRRHILASYAETMR